MKVSELFVELGKLVYNETDNIIVDYNVELSIIESPVGVKLDSSDKYPPSETPIEIKVDDRNRKLYINATVGGSDEL